MSKDLWWHISFYHNDLFKKNCFLTFVFCKQSFFPFLSVKNIEFRLQFVTKVTQVSWNLQFVDWLTCLKRKVQYIHVFILIKVQKTAHILPWTCCINSHELKALQIKNKTFQFQKLKSTVTALIFDFVMENFKPSIQRTQQR